MTNFYEMLSVSVAVGGLVRWGWPLLVEWLRRTDGGAARSLREEMTAAGMDPAPLPAYLLVWRGLAGGLLVVGWFVLGMPLPAAALASIAYHAGPWWVRVRVAAYRRRINEQAAGAARVIAGHLRAALPLGKAVAVVARDAPAPLGDHLRRTALRLAVGTDARVAFAALKAGCRVEAVVALAVAQRVADEKGGKLADVLDRIGDTAEAVAGVERKREALTAGHRLSIALLAAFPAVFLGYTAVIDPRMATTIFDTAAGQATLAVVALVVYASLRWAAAILGRAG